MSGFKSIQDNASLEKTRTGIEGFDIIARGGLPRNRATLVMGGTGTGKTVFALQALANGARRGEPGIFVAFEEGSEQIKDNAESFGWGLRELEQQGKLFFLDARRLTTDVIQSGAFELTGMLATLETKASEMGARFIVFDAFDVMLTLLNDPLSEMKESYALHDWLSRRGLTGMITVRFNLAATPLAERYYFMKFTADCIVQLSHYIVDQVSVRGLGIEKYRGSSFREGELPMVIGPQGIEIVTPPLEKPMRTEFGGRVSSGVERLDEMLGGGYLRGTSILVVGDPGTAKTTLAAAFAQSACMRGEKAVYIALDQRSDILVQDMTSLNIHLQPHIESGLLTISHYYSSNQSREQFLVNARNMIRQDNPKCMVIDSLSAISRTKGRLSSEDLAAQLVFLTVSEGITLVITSIQDGSETTMDRMETPISTVVDTLIQVSFYPLAGERNRVLSIVKSRGTSHSNQMRELILSGQGITLADIYSEEGEVLMGTLRWQKEREAQRNKEKVRQEFEDRLRQLKHEQAQTLARIEDLKGEALWQQEDEKRLRTRQNEQEERWVMVVEKFRKMRGSGNES